MYTFIEHPQALCTRRIDEVLSLPLVSGQLSTSSKAVQIDLAEAVRCIPLERPTAAAFHLLRGIEPSFQSSIFSPSH